MSRGPFKRIPFVRANLFCTLFFRILFFPLRRNEESRSCGRVSITAPRYFFPRRTFLKPYFFFFLLGRQKKKTYKALDTLRALISRENLSSLVQISYFFPTDFNGGERRRCSRRRNSFCTLTYVDCDAARKEERRGWGERTQKRKTAKQEKKKGICCAVGLKRKSNKEMFLWNEQKMRDRKSVV